MSQERLLLDAIRKDPADDLARLAYADWLEEREGRGDRDRAEFIRVQVELARLDAMMEEEGEHAAPCPCCARYFILAQREASLLPLVSPIWRGGNGLIWRRGFVEEAACTTEEFMEKAAQLAVHSVRRIVLIDRRPLPALSVSGLPVWQWASEEDSLWRVRWRLPPVLFALLDPRPPGAEYDSEELAMAALSAACVKRIGRLAP